MIESSASDSGRERSSNLVDRAPDKRARKVRNNGRLRTILNLNIVLPVPPTSFSTLTGENRGPYSRAFGSYCYASKRKIKPKREREKQRKSHRKGGNTVEDCLGKLKSRKDKKKSKSTLLHLYAYGGACTNAMMVHSVAQGTN